MEFDEVPPIEEGDIIDGVIDSVGKKDDGVLKIGTFVVFVPNSKEGEKVTVKITRVLRKYAFSEKVDKKDSETF